MAPRWPFPGWTPLAISRHVAGVYREHLRVNNLALCGHVDEVMVGYGQLWIVPRPAIIHPGQAVTGDIAAELVSRPETTIRRWACQPHPDHPDRPLLPRYGRDGRRTTYLAADVLEAARVTETGTRHPAA
jgi:hypothetical protein